MSSNKLRLLAIGIVMLGAAAPAFARGDDTKESESNTQASVGSTSVDAKGCCAKGAKAQSAARLASKECGSKSSSNVVFASTAGGDHCASGSKSAKSMADCSYGENTVTMAGACPAKNEADYSFYVAGAESRGTGTAAAQAVKSVKGVASVTVDYEKRMVYVCADGKAASRKSIEKSLKNAGYDEVKFVNASKQNCQKSQGKIEA